MNRTGRGMHIMVLQITETTMVCEGCILFESGYEIIDTGIFAMKPMCAMVKR